MTIHGWIWLIICVAFVFVTIIYINISYVIARVRYITWNKVIRFYNDDPNCYPFFYYRLDSSNLYKVLFFIFWPITYYKFVCNYPYGEKFALSDNPFDDSGYFYLYPYVHRMYSHPSFYTKYIILTSLGYFFWILPIFNIFGYFFIITLVWVTYVCRLIYLTVSSFIDYSDSI